MLRRSLGWLMMVIALGNWVLLSGEARRTGEVIVDNMDHGSCLEAAENFFRLKP